MTYYYYTTYTNELVIIILPKKNLTTFLQSDIDQYYKKLSDHNLKFRKIKNKEIFLKEISKNVYECLDKDKQIIINAIKKADRKLKKIKYPGFYYNKIEQYPWLIGCSISSQYEFGYPHTRHNIIIINTDNLYNKDLYKTLIHERIHIYQKLFPEYINEFLNHFKFEKVRLQNDNDLANPDTDSNIYKQNNIIFECKIESPYIDNFYDFNNNKYKLRYTNNSCKYEHPFEYMAYEIVELAG